MNFSRKLKKIHPFLLLEIIEKSNPSWRAASLVFFLCRYSPTWVKVQNPALVLQNSFHSCWYQMFPTGSFFSIQANCFNKETDLVKSSYYFGYHLSDRKKLFCSYFSKWTYLKLISDFFPRKTLHKSWQANVVNETEHVRTQ